MKKLFTLFCLLVFTTASYATSIVYDFEALLSGGYTTINSSGTKSFEGKALNVISSFTNAGGDVGVNVNGRIAALYQSGNGSNFWFRDASRPWFVSAGKTSYMAFDDLKAGDVVKIIGALTPLTILCDNVEGYEKGTTFDATYTEDAPLELVAKVDGYIYGSYGGYTAIKKIVVESSAAEAASDPIITVTAANDTERTVTIDANIGSAGTAQTAYYTLDGSEPTNASTEYTAPFTVSETTTVKAVAYCGETMSNVVMLEVEAGFVIKLNDAVLEIKAMQAEESQFAPVYGVSADNSQLIGAPTATLSASFFGEDVTADLMAGTFIPNANGELIVTSTAEGYESSTVMEVVYSTYDQTYASADYSTLTDEASVQNALGTEWSKNEPTRWANWSKYNAIYGDRYNVYSYTGEAGGNIYLDKDNMLRGPKALQFMESFGFGRGVSGATTVSIENTGTPQDITLYRVINSKGLDENAYTETFVKSADNIIHGDSYSEFNIPGCETLCQVTIYSPAEVQSTYTIKFINTLDWKTVYVWAWDVDDDNLVNLVGGVWPGEEMTKTGEQIGGHDVYTWSYTGDLVPAGIIFNNGYNGDDTAQTEEYEFVNNGVYNIYGFFVYDDELVSYNVKYINTLDWEQVWVHVWDDSNENNVWPGEEMTKTDEQVNGHDVYIWNPTSYFVPSNIEFSNGGNGEQTSYYEFVDNGIYNLYGFVKIDGEPDPEWFVVLPEGVRAWEWELQGDLSDGDYVPDAQVAFDGTDVYLCGLSSINGGAWIRGTLDTETNLITFPRGQNISQNVDDPVYMIGLAGRNFCDIVFEFDVYAQTLTQVTPAILENGDTKTLDVRSYWENVVLRSLETVSFTVRYVDGEDNEIKPARIGWGKIGRKYDLLESDQDPVYTDDGQTKYTYISMVGDYHHLASDPEKNIITFVFEKHTICYASVSCMSNGNGFKSLAQYEGTFYDGEELIIDLPWGLRDSDGRCYFTSSNTGGDNHGRTVLFPSNYQPAVRYGKTYYTAVLLYNENPLVAYYADCATLVLPPEGNEYGKGLGQCNGSYEVLQNSGWSLGNTIDLKEDSYLWTEPIAEAGTYRVEIYLHKGFQEATDEPFVFGYRDAEGNKFLYTDLNIPTYGEGFRVDTNVTENVSIPAGASLIVLNRLPSNEMSLDDITLYKTGDFVEPIVDGIKDLKDFKGFKDLKDLKDSKDLIFNLAGQRLSKPAKGINIVGGKKMLIK